MLLNPALKARIKQILAFCHLLPLAQFLWGVMRRFSHSNTPSANQQLTSKLMMHAIEEKLSRADSKNIIIITPKQP